MKWALVFAAAGLLRFAKKKQMSKAFDQKQLLSGVLR
jgi:hypothetical protein